MDVARPHAGRKENGRNITFRPVLFSRVIELDWLALINDHPGLRALLSLADSDNTLRASG